MGTPSKVLDDETRDFLKWLAQTVHQVYHTDHPGTWNDCPMSICKAVYDFLEERSVETQVAHTLMEDD